MSLISLCAAGPVFGSIYMALFRYGSGGDTTICGHVFVGLGRRGGFLTCLTSNRRVFFFVFFFGSEDSVLLGVVQRH